MDKMQVIKKRLKFDDKAIDILLDDNNNVLVPYSTIEHFLNYDKGTFVNKLRSKNMKSYMIAYDVHLLEVDIINDNRNLCKKAMYINDMFDLIRYELEKLNKNKKECKLLSKVIDNYILDIKNKL